MKTIRAAVVGYGNVGRFALEALEMAPDFEVAGIVRRNGALNLPLELTNYKVVQDIKELKRRGCGHSGMPDAFMPRVCQTDIAFRH